MQRFQATGDVSPARFGGFKTAPLLAHELEIRGWIEADSEVTIAEIRKRLAERGTKASPAAASRYLRKLGLPRK